VAGTWQEERTVSDRGIRCNREAARLVADRSRPGENTFHLYTSRTRFRDSCKLQRPMVSSAPPFWDALRVCESSPMPANRQSVSPFAPQHLQPW
jgi:hypothetical protein